MAALKTPQSDGPLHQPIDCHVETPLAPLFPSADVQKWSESFEPPSSGRKRTHADAGLAHETQDGDKRVIEAGIRPDEQVHEEKRSRKVGRHLDKNYSKGGKTSKPSSPSREATLARYRDRPARTELSSKFIEGSMNDKPSIQPPGEYIEQDHLMEQYMAPSGERPGRASEDSAISHDAGIRSARPSSMYRFGKALANVFNPVMVWHGFNNRWSNKPENILNPQHILLDNRRSEAERAYAALKKEGYPGTQRFSNTDDSLISQEEHGIQPSSRDSGIDVDGYRSSTERKRDGIVFDSDDTLKVPFSARGSVFSISPLSRADAVPKPGSRLRKPSFSGLRKVKSHLHLPSGKSVSISPAPIPTIDHDLQYTLAEQNVVRKQPSRKDLQKQQKLTKKVSDLESQLDKARRELQEAMEPVPPVPPLLAMGALRPFVPGALASLPSERLMDGYLQDSTPVVSESVSEMLDETDDKRRFSRSRGQPLPRYERATSKGAVQRKRKCEESEDLSMKSELEDKEKMLTPINAEPFAGTLRTNAHKVAKQSSPASARATRNNNLYAVATHTKSNNADISSGTCPSFSPAKIDIPKMLAMRSNPDSIVPFARLSEDIVNLKKEFPGITSDQIIKYLAVVLIEKDAHHPARTSSRQTFKAESKSITHYPSHSQSRSSEPHASGRQYAPSPTKTTPTFRRSLSPPPSPSDTPHQPSSPLNNSWTEADEQVVMISPSKSGSIPPVPKVPDDLAGQKVTVREEGAELGEFQWPDDVF